MARARRGILTIISGFSGAGKGTLMDNLLKKYDDQLALSVSATTRAPRPGEEDGVHYFFKTTEAFEEMIAQDQFLEYAQYVGNYYGTPIDFVEAKLSAGIDVILEIERQGALNVKARLPEVLMIFVTPPSIEELERRLKNRGTETSETINKRLETAVEEAEYIKYYDYLVVNDDLDECTERIHQIIENEHDKVTRSAGFIKDLKEELRTYRKGE